MTQADTYTPEELAIKARFEAELRQAKDDYDAKVLEIWRAYDKAMQEYEWAPATQEPRP